MTRAITTALLVAESGASERQVLHWARKGWISPANGPLAGPGHPAAWDIALVERLRAALARIEWGMAVGPALFREVDPPLPSHHGWHLEVSEHDGWVRVLATDGDRFLTGTYPAELAQGSAA